jgi:quaternary ammonium compound-resistance protein SugE
VNGWLLLVAAGVVEVGWARSIAPTENFTRPWPSLVCLVLMGGAVYLLSRAMSTVPVATSYVVFTGIGAIGTVVLGVVLDRDPATPTRLLAVGMIVVGIVLAHVTARA